LNLVGGPTSNFIFTPLLPTSRLGSCFFVDHSIDRTDRYDAARDHSILYPVALGVLFETRSPGYGETRILIYTPSEFKHLQTARIWLQAILSLVWNKISNYKYCKYVLFNIYVAYLGTVYLDLRLNCLDLQVKLT